MVVRSWLNLAPPPPFSLSLSLSLSLVLAGLVRVPGEALHLCDPSPGSMCCQWLGPSSRQPKSTSSTARHRFDTSGMRAMTGGGRGAEGGA
ncbi:hypothetical protein LX36DRAFT_659795 [Colletotrichum falcatum]|nr:hypothetical protein LX36DRAFT_659795 [Colletotrichum falcatum]